MTTGRGVTQYCGHNFPSIVEAQWAVFFETRGEVWHYDREATWGLVNAQHYRPQFALPRLDAYFEVQRPHDHQTRRSLQYDHPEIKEPVVYLAVGDLPDERQLGTTGWWDPGRSQGVRNLTPGDDWKAWFPPDYPDVLRAMEFARTTKFGPAIPEGRRTGEGIRDIPKQERERHPR